MISHNPSNSPRRILGLAFLTVILVASPGHAAAVYTLTNLGAVGNSTNLDVFNAAGQITSIDGGGSPVRSQDGPYTIETRTADMLPYNYVSYLLAPGQPTVLLDTPVANPAFEEVIASAVNKSGTVVGTENGDGYLFGVQPGAAFMYSKAGGMQAVPLPYSSPGVYGVANSINDAGLIVGTINNPLSNPQSQTLGFLSDGHTAWDLNTLIASGSGLILTSAIDINDQGQILGQAMDSQHNIYNVLLTPTPTPEPGAWLLLAGGGGALVVRRRGLRGRK